MMPTVAELPDDVDTLKAMVLATVEQRAAMEAENRRIASEIAALKLINTTSDTRIAELTAIVKTFERMLYGTRSERLRGERLDDEQIDFVFDEIETGVAAIDAELETAAKDKPKRAPRPRKGFAPHLERIEQVIEPEVPAGCEDLEKVLIGEDMSERLDVTAAKFRVLVTRRPKYAYRGRDGVIQAPAPPHIIESGIPTEALLAQIAVAKYADGLPLYRQEAIYARDKTELSRSLMAQWMGKVGFELQPLADYVLERIKQGERVFADETTLPTLAPGTGKTQKAWLWAYARDDSPSGAPVRRWSPIASRTAAAATAWRVIWRALPAFCRWMVTPPIHSWPKRKSAPMKGWLSRAVGPICADGSMNCTSTAVRKLRRRRSQRWPGSGRLRRRSAAAMQPYA